MAGAQQSAGVEKDGFQLLQSQYDFGKIPQGKPVVHEFEWKNESPFPVTITDIQASCGCTTPEWDKSPIAPGKVSKIKIGYNSAAEGPFNKSVIVRYNQDKMKTITISGEVFRGPATPAPLNPSIAFIKQNHH